MALLVRPFDVLWNQISDVLDAKNLRGLVWFRELRVFAVAGNVRLVTLSSGFGTGRVTRAR